MASTAATLSRSFFLSYQATYGRRLRGFPNGNRRISDRIAAGFAIYSLSSQRAGFEHFVTLCRLTGSWKWNCQGERRDLWQCVLQFRPSGLRAKRYVACPALVAMTTTQIPVLGPERRFLTRIEGLRLQGFPDRHLLPKTRAHVFRALGNAVHVAVATAVAEGLLGSHDQDNGRSPEECTP